MFLSRCTRAGVAALALTTAAAANAAFVAPAQWSVGDADTTYQEWDVMSAAGTPDIGVSSPGAPTLAPTSPGFATGSGNFYSFGGDYGIDADIANHTGAAAGLGTHVIVQTASTLNGADGVYANTLEVTDSLGNALVGGDNASVLQHEVIFEGVVSSTFGDVLIREEIWEFYLPNYVGDFQVLADVKVHSSFQRMRVDSAIASQAYATTAVPEPGSLALLGLGALATLRRRRSA